MDKSSFSTQITSSVIPTGTAIEGLAGPSIGHVDIGISELAYMFRVSLPGVRNDKCELSCDIERNGKVHIKGVVTSEVLTDSVSSSKKYQLGVAQLSPPGPFSVTFKLPGPVDPRLFSPLYRADGIFEGVVMKYNRPAVVACAEDVSVPSNGE